MDESLQKQLVRLQAQQASSWLEIMDGKPTARQRADFLSWLKQSPHHVREILVMFELEAQFGQIDRERRHDVEKLIKAAATNVVALRSEASAMDDGRSLARRAWLNWLTAAAACLIAGLAVWALRPRMAGQWQEIDTMVGEQRAWELSDGSIVNLNTNSRIAVQFSENAREVRLLQGEALFRVHHDPSRPFRVHAANAVVQAIGTQFNVYARGDSTRVAVVEGRVTVTAVRDSALSGRAGKNAPAPASVHEDTPTLRNLGANEAAQIDKDGAVQIHTMADAADAIAWRERRLIFRDDNLRYIVQEFNRYNREQIRLDESLEFSRTYSGVFDADDPEAFLQVLVKDGSLDIQTLGADYLIKARK